MAQLGHFNIESSACRSEPEATLTLKPNPVMVDFVTLILTAYMGLKASKKFAKIL